MSSEQPDGESTADAEAAAGATGGGDSDAVGGNSGDEDGGVEPEGAPDIGDLDDRLDDLRAEFDAFEADIDDRTVEKPAVKADLKRYVRRRLRRGHARGWGPYLVLLYGTVMTLGAFYWLSNDWVAMLAMLIIFLSTLGLYTLFVIVGVGFNLLGAPGKALDFVRERRD
jgi:membrane protein